MRTTPSNYKNKAQNNDTRNLSHGFSLIELIIVILILGIISMIAIPNLLAARRAANEASAISNIRMIFSSQSSYLISSTTRNFGTFGQLQTAGYIDSTIAAAPAVKSGYFFEMDLIAPTVTTPAQFNLRARPVVHSSVQPLTASGSKDYGLCENGVIYQTDDNTPVLFDAVTRTATGTAAPAGNN